MTLDDILTVIEIAHKNNDPDSVDGVVRICQEICDELNLGECEAAYWTEEAMKAIAYAAYDAAVN